MIHPSMYIRTLTFNIFNQQYKKKILLDTFKGVSSLRN